MSPHEAPIQAGGESQDSGLEAGAGGRGAEGTGGGIQGCASVKMQPREHVRCVHVTACQCHLDNTHVTVQNQFSRNFRMFAAPLGKSRCVWDRPWTGTRKAGVM